MSNLQGRRVVIVGGTSGIGKATAVAALRAGAHVTVAGRSEDKLRASIAEIGGDSTALVVDITNDTSVRQFADRIGLIHHLVVTASSVSTGPVRQLPVEQAIRSMDSKFFGPYRLAQAVRLTDDGSLVLVSGALSRRPSAGMAILAAINAAVEAFGRGLALELAPVRVNVISPGLTDTPAHAGMPEAHRRGMLEGAATRLPVGRVGRPEDIADAIVMTLGNGFMTGAVVDVDGGALIAG